MFTVSADGGLPELLPVAYGTAGAVSPDGKWIAYTPHNRDFRTWKRYQGGLADDIWLFNLETYESRKATDWAGTDTLPMWAPGDASTLYYLSDAGPEHRLNIWKYDLASGNRTQVTTYNNLDVKFPSMGPSANGNGGSIVFQLGADLRVLDLRGGEAAAITVEIPGERPTIRPKLVDFSDYISDFTISPEGKMVGVEARGDIWTAPAEADKGWIDNITATSGTAERNPLWSPDGRWIAYLSDESGEYQIYVRESTATRGKRETKQLTTNLNAFSYLEAWTPDSKKIVFSDKTGMIYLLDVASGDITEITQNMGANRTEMTISHDSRWIGMSLPVENTQNAIFLYNIEDQALNQVTSGFFNATSPAFDREGDWFYYTSQMNFDASMSELDTTFIFENSQRILAVPLHSDIESPLVKELDLVEWELPDADDDDDNADDKNNDSDDAQEGSGDDLTVSEVPLHGKWTATISGLAQMGLPDDSLEAEMNFIVDDVTGEIYGWGVTMGEEDDMSSISYDLATGELVTSDSEDGVESEQRGTVTDDKMTGTWSVSIAAAGMSFDGTWTAEKISDEFTEDDVEKALEYGPGGEMDLDAKPGDKPAKKNDKKEEVEPINIELEGFESRSIALPMGPGTYAGLSVNDKNELIFMSFAGVPTIRIYDISDFEDDAATVVAGVGGYAMSANGKKLFVVTGDGGAVISAASGQSLSKRISTDGMEHEINPREEWAQILQDSYRIFRDFFYDEGMHGVDWEAEYRRYAAMLPDATTREDVSYLIREMISELNVGHAYYNGGDEEGQSFRNVGLLGCDFELATVDGNTAYKVAHIYRGAPWDADARGPLTMPGIDVNEGDFILAVNGKPINTEKDPWAAFIGLAGKTTQIIVSDKPVWDEDAREVIIEPLASDSNLRFRDWIETNRKHVEYRSGGKVGYIYVTNTSMDGLTDLWRQFYGQRDKDAILIDERWNGGGFIPNRFVELLNRPRTNMWARRDGQDWDWPYDSHQGHKAMLINGPSGSGGDMFPWLFKQQGLGPLIGERTWGGLVGISSNPSLIDGGSPRVPTFGFYETDGTWGIEGHGVDPDIQVIADPALMVKQSRTEVADPQLDAGIDYLLEQVRTRPVSKPKRPASPDRSGMGIRPEDR